MRDSGSQACAGIHCFSPVYSGHVSFATKDWPTWVAQGCVQGPQGFGSLDRRVFSDPGGGDGGGVRGYRPAIKTLPVFADVLEWNQGRWQEEPAMCARGSWGAKGRELIVLFF